MLYPCFHCDKKTTCKQNCPDKEKYLQYRKDSVEKNRKWSKGSVIIKGDLK